MSGTVCVVPPPFLVQELRLGFRSCALKQSRLFQSRTYATGASRTAKPPKQVSKSNTAARPSSAAVDKVRDAKDFSHDQAALTARTSRRDLAPITDNNKALRDHLRENAPAKLVPRAKISNNLTITPKEQMQVEFLTRLPPKKPVPKIYKKRLLIYHAGKTKNAVVRLTKMFSMVPLCFGLTIFAPAYILAGYSWYTVGAILFCSVAPGLTYSWLTKPYVTWIYLPLPEYARHSPKAALDYAKSLPYNAQLELSFMRAFLPDTVSLNIADLAPARKTFRKLDFEWVGHNVKKGPIAKRNPTAFWVKQSSTTDKAARDVTPGVWEHVYNRIMGLENSTVSRWRTGTATKKAGD